MENQLNQEEFLKDFLNTALGKNTMVHIRDMAVNQAVRINQFRFIDTVNGRRVAVDFDNNTWAILPQRISNKVTTNEQIGVLNAQNYTMIYLGRDESRMNMILLDFRVIPVATFNISNSGIPADLMAEIMAEVNGEAEASKPKSKKMKR